MTTLDIDFGMVSEENYIYDTSTGSWVGTELNVSMYENQKLKEVYTYSYDVVEKDWINNKYTLTTYVDGKVYSTCGYKLHGDTYEKYGTEIFSRPEYEGSTIIDHIWESETSGETSQNMEVFTILRVEGIKKYEVYLKFRKDTLESNFVMYSLYEAKFNGDEFISCIEETENLPTYREGVLYEKFHYIAMSEIDGSEYSYAFIYSEEKKVIIPENKIVSMYTNAYVNGQREVLYRIEYTDYSYENNGWMSYREESANADSDGYITDKTYIVVQNLTITEKVVTTILERDSNHQVITHLEDVYDINNGIVAPTKTEWRVTTTYYDNGSTRACINQRKDNGEWVYIWKYECPEIEGGYGFVVYHWVNGVWVEGEPDYWNA